MDKNHKVIATAKELPWDQVHSCLAPKPQSSSQMKIKFNAKELLVKLRKQKEDAGVLKGGGPGFSISNAENIASNC